MRATRGYDNFLSITESRKMQNPDGSFSYDRHKIFLYKEDFAKFSEGLSEAVDFIRRSKPEFFERKPEPALATFSATLRAVDTSILSARTIMADRQRMMISRICFLIHDNIYNE